MTAELMKQIAKDVGEIKEKLRNIEITIEELESDFHEVRPEYIEKLKKIDAGKFLSEKEFDKGLAENV
ncbi:MAG: hypothetical protein KJ767_02700 [Nanoarchaeota archaeon]|nr:hypothetical protein [Nanoarchaeota archaeon]